VLVEMTQRVARELAAGMFDEAAADVADADVMDALGEVANMIGGNVKALLGATSLSLPSVTSGDRFVVHVPGSRLETTSAFECLGDPARVLLLTSQA
jgi:CheY-specific phosphatase CheX